MAAKRFLLALALGAVAVLVPPGAVFAQAGRGGAPPAPASPTNTVLYAYTLQHQPASDALELVRPMLSAVGMVKLQTDTRTLEVRDDARIIERVAAMLRSFDHPPRLLVVEVMVVRAAVSQVSPPPSDSPGIPEELLRKWRSLLRYEHYQLVARTALEPREGEQVTYEMGAGYRISFRLGTLLADRRVKLHNFRLVRAHQEGQQELIHTNLNPWLGRSTALGLAHDETSRTALMVVVICRNPGSG